MHEQTPVEQLKRLQRTTQKYWEYNTSATSSFSKELASLLAAGSPTTATTSSEEQDQAEQLALIDSLLSKTRSMKKKLTALSTETTAVLDVLSTRLTDLVSLPASSSSASYPDFARTRLSALLADYFLRSSPPLLQSAKRLAEEEQVGKRVDWGLWEECWTVEKDLSEHKLGKALEWCQENRGALRKLKVSRRKRTPALGWKYRS